MSRVLDQESIDVSLGDRVLMHFAATRCARGTSVDRPDAAGAQTHETRDLGLGLLCLRLLFGTTTVSRAQGPPSLRPRGRSAVAGTAPTAPTGRVA